MSDQIVEVKNQGPIVYLRLNFEPLKKGGIMVLYGPNGSGKSSALDGINQLVSRQGRLVSRDESPGAEITGFSARVALGRKTSRSGELEVLSLEGFSIADLVEPGIKDQPARDGKRIKALLRLAGAEAKAEMFYPLLSNQEEFDLYIPSEALATDDLVTMQGSIKRALEKAARDQGEIATRELTQAEALRLAAADIDTNLPDDSDLLSASFEDATREQARLKAEAKAATEATDKAKNAKISLQVIKNTYKGPTAELADEDRQLKDRLSGLAKERVEELEELLREAKASLVDCDHELELAEATYTAAAAYEESVKALEEAAATNAELVTEDVLSAAAERLRLTKEAVETGALVRQAKDNLAKSESQKKVGMEAKNKAESLRLAAQSSEMVLSSAVESLGVPLKVFNSRLVATNTERPNEVFDDLSEGEQWKTVADIAVKTVGPGGLIILPQRAWQDLDQNNRRILAEAVTCQEPEGVGVMLLTAQCDSNFPEVTAVMYDPFPLVE